MRCNCQNNQLGFLDFGIWSEESPLTEEAWADVSVDTYTPPPEENFDWGGFFDSALNVAKQGVDVYAAYERAQLPTGQTVYQPRTAQPIYTATATTPQSVSNMMNSGLMKILLPVTVAGGVYLLARR